MGVTNERLGHVWPIHSGSEWACWVGFPGVFLGRLFPMIGLLVCQVVLNRIDTSRQPNCESRQPKGYALFAEIRKVASGREVVLAELLSCPNLSSQSRPHKRVP